MRIQQRKSRLIAVTLGVATCTLLLSTPAWACDGWSIAGACLGGVGAAPVLIQWFQSAAEKIKSWLSGPGGGDD